MSMHYGSVELCVPAGFQNVLHLISQEVLRVKPKNTLEFIAGVLDDLLVIREESGYDPVTHGEMIDRVQEQYWKIQQQRNELSGRPLRENTTENNMPETFDGSGDVGVPTSVEENVEALLMIAMHRDNGEEAEHSHVDEEADQPHQVATQQETVAEQSEAVAEEQEGESGEDTIDKEVERGENLEEGHDEDTESTTEQVATATEEEEIHTEEVGEKDDDK